MPAATAVLAEVQAAVRELLKAVVPGEMTKTVDVERALDVEHKLGWAMYQIATLTNPLAIAPHIPAPVTMRRLLKAASRPPRRGGGEGAPAAVIERVSEAMERFEELVRLHAGDRATLETMLAAHLPEAWEKQELASKKAAYKGMSDLLGIMVDVEYSTEFWHPSPKDESSVEVVSLRGTAGLRRVRPGRYLARKIVESVGPKPATVTLDGEPIGPDEPDSRLVREFCSESTLKLEIDRRGSTTNYWFTGQDVGLQSAVDYVLGSYGPASRPRYSEPGKKKLLVLSLSNKTSSKRLTQDVFIHRDVYPNVVPQVRVYQTAAEGLVNNFLKDDREQDLMQTHEVVRPIMGGTLSASLPGVGRYGEMIKYVFAKRGWDPGAFRGYRLDVQYPVYGFQYMLVFEVPERPSQDSTTTDRSR